MKDDKENRNILKQVNKIYNCRSRVTLIHEVI